MIYLWFILTDFPLSLLRVLTHLRGGTNDLRTTFQPRRVPRLGRRHEPAPSHNARRNNNYKG